MSCIHGCICFQLHIQRGCSLLRSRFCPYKWYLWGEFRVLLRSNIKIMEFFSYYFWFLVIFSSPSPLAWARSATYSFWRAKLPWQELQPSLGWAHRVGATTTIVLGVCWYVINLTRVNWHVWSTFGIGTFHLGVIRCRRFSQPSSRVWGWCNSGQEDTMLESTTHSHVHALSCPPHSFAELHNFISLVY